MIQDFSIIQNHYDTLKERVTRVRAQLNRPLTLTEKILYSHLYYGSSANCSGFVRGESYADFRPDRVAMQDATAQMAVLQFMNANKDNTLVPTTIHCDHLVMAHRGAEVDLPLALEQNKEVYDFLASAAKRYNMGFWPAGAGIIHQIVLENYAFPGGMMVGTDSHTPNAGGLGMLAIGVGGADAVDVMTGQAWELKVPRIIGVHLKGSCSGWVSPKDVILHLASILTVKGGTNAVIEYFGEGCKSLSCTGKATICNMGAEVGATTSIFPYDEQMSVYLKATGREKVARLADENIEALRADNEVSEHPEKYYDRIIEIDLDQLVPHINGPFTPDLATPVDEMGKYIAEKDYPDIIDTVLIGSCTNSSYEDLACAAYVAGSALRAGYRPKSGLVINPGSEKIRATAERDGLLEIFRECGAVIMTNACGPCIGQWKRITEDNTRRNSIVTTFNRNFAKRADGNPNTYAFITSPEIAMAYAFTGKLSVSPLEFFDFVPYGEKLPSSGFCGEDKLERAPESVTERAKIVVAINPGSERLQRLEPFMPNEKSQFQSLPLLIKTQGKCTTDHISMAGPWLKYRGHIENISRNLLMGAIDAFTGETKDVGAAALGYKLNGNGSFVAAEDNYGEGSSREHAAMEPRFLEVRFIIAKSFARIHETNLKKQGVLALTFANPGDYDLIRNGDIASLDGLDDFSPDSSFSVVLTHTDGTQDVIRAKHTYNEQQIKWFWAGSALNTI